MLTAGLLLHILLVEKDDADAAAIRQALTDAGYLHTVERARSEREFRALVSGRFDLVIANWHFSGRNGVRATELMREHEIDVPLVFISDHGADKKNLLAGEPYLIQVLKDITERKEEERTRYISEARTARAQRAQQVLLESNRALSHERNEEKLLGEVCRILVESGGYLQAWAGLAMHDAQCSVRPAAAAGVDEYLERHAMSWANGGGDSVMGRVIASGAPHVSRDILRDPNAFHRRARARKRGFQSSITLPLHFDGRCVGGLAIYAREPDAFEEEEVDLLATLGRDVAYGITAIRKEEARRQAEAQLARVLRARRVMAECNHALIHATDEPALLRDMCRIVVESGGYVQSWIGFPTGNPARPVRPAAHAGYGDSEPLSSGNSWDADGRYRGPMGRVITEGRPIIMRDIIGNTQESWSRARAEQLGYQSAIMMPLVSEGRVLGAISIHAREADAFDEEEIKLVTELANDLAYGITALRTRVAREYAERQLRASENRYRETFNQAAVGIARVDLDGVFTDVNQKLCDMLGYGRDELVGKAVKDITHPDDRGRGARIRRGARSGGPRTWVNEKRFVHKGGAIIWARRTMSVAQDDAGRPQYVISIVEDITASKALEQRFAATFNQAAVGIMHSSLDRRVLLVNQRLCEMLGYSEAELADIPEQKLHHPIDAHADEALEAKLVAGEIETFSLEKRYVRKDGRTIWCRRTVSLARDAEALPQYFIRVFEDITERKEAEERYRAIVQQAPVGIVQSRLDGAIVQANPRLSEIVGYTEQELLGMNTRALVHLEDQGIERGTRMRQLIEGRVSSFTSEKRMVRKDAAVVWVRRTVSLVRDSAGAPLYVVRLVEDITSQREAEERYRATFDNAPVGILHTAVDDDRILHVNRKACEILGYTEDELLAIKTGQIAISGERGLDRERYSGPMLAGTMPSFSSERQYLRKDGTHVWTNRTISLVRDASGKPLYFIRIIEDISARKRIEHDLRRSIERFEVVARATNDAVWDWDLETDKLWWNEGFQTLFGYRADEIDPSVASWYEHIHEEDRERVVRGIHDAIDKGTQYWADEYRFKRADGTDAHIYDRGYVIRESDGRAVRMVGAMMDITERKRAEQALERTSRLNALLRALATAANEAVTPEEAFRACLAHLGAFSGWTLGRAVVFGKTQADYAEQFSIWYGAETERWAAFRRASEPFGTHADVGLVKGVFVTGKALWIESLPDAPRYRRAAVARDCGLRSALAFPVVAAGGSYALVEFYADHHVPTEPELLDALPQISAQLARVAERRFSENALLESERFARSTMDALSQHICVVDEAGTIIAVNKSWRSFAEGNGYSPRTPWEGENFFEVSDKATGMSAAEVAFVASGIRDVLAGTQDEFTTEYSCSGRGEQRWFSLKATRFPGSGPRRAVIACENITERALSHRRRVMEHAVTTVLAESASLGEAMPKLIRTMCESMDWAYGALWQWSERDALLQRLDHWCDAPLQLDPADAPLWEELRGDGHIGLLRRGLQERDANWMVDVQGDPSFKRRASARKMGFVSAYSFPIIANNNVMGMMEFFGREARQPDEMLLLATRSVGSQIGQYIQRKEAEQALRLSEERFRITVSQASVGITMTSLDLRYLMVNDRYCAIMGYAREELLALGVKDVVKPGEFEEAVSFRARLLADEAESYDREKQLRRKDGSLVWVNLSSSLVRGERGEPKYYISVIQDISDRKRAELALRESEEKFLQLSSNIPQVFWISDATLKETIYISAACGQMLGVPAEELKASPRRLVRAVHREDRARVYHARKSAPQGQYDEIYRIVRPDGTVRWVQDRAFPVRDADGLVRRVAGIAEDITHRKEAEEKLVYLAHYDALTGLPNRNMFHERLTDATAQARRRGKLVAVMFLDLDRFKVTNDTLGHSAGDELLIQVARRLTDRVRIGDTVGRFGGDEFGLILADLRSVEDARGVAEKMMVAFEAPFLLEHSEVYVTGSIGISIYPADSDDVGSLMKNADAAMYRAKEAGRNNFQFYTAEMNARALHRLEMENSLRRALERREFIFHYQPKIDLVTGRITGVEALLRWQRPGHGMVQPVEFVPLLEDSGLIISIGEWLLHEACLQLRTWERAGIAPVPIAINLSARQFASRDLGGSIQRVLEHHGIPPALLQLELTESSLMTNNEDVVQMLRYLKSLGLHLSIDDFGTGYSSLAYLQLFPIDALKIDRSFVSDIRSELDDATIIRAVIGMAHSLGLKVVAEGVENEAQLTFLTQNGCDEIQGYYYSPPLSAEECGELLLAPPPLRRAAASRDAA